MSKLCVYLQAMVEMNYNRLRVILFEKDLTQEQFAKKIGKTTTTVGNWCRNDNQPRVEMLFIIADKLNCRVSDILLENPQPKKTK